MLVSCEVRGHPVHDHADTCVVRAVDEIHEFFRLAIARRRRIIARDLITPAWIVGILHQRHDLDVGISHIDHIIDQLMRQLVVAKPLLPAAEMHLVDVHRLAVGIGLILPTLDIILIGPLIVRHVADDRGRSVRFCTEGEGIRFQNHFACISSDRIFVKIARARHADGDFPNAGGTDALHRIGLLVPFVKRADHTDGLRIRCPDGKTEHPFPEFTCAFVAAEFQICRRGNAAIKVIECCFVRKFVHPCNPRVLRYDINVIWSGDDNLFCCVCRAIALVQFASSFPRDSRACLSVYLSSYHHLSSKGTSS